jgi:hypothetical protein
MIVWGGLLYDGSFHWYDTGGVYDPATDSWTPTSQTGAPEARHGHGGIWTGSLLVVWGGIGAVFHDLGTGGRYDPVADAWTPMSDQNAPSPRAARTMVWTGSQAIVWGGLGQGFLASGGIYTP